MIEQPALVVRVDGPDAWVRVGAVSGCPACDQGRGCGAGVFGRLLRRRPVELRLANRIGAQPGSAVRIGIPESVFVRLALRLYGLPLAAALAGSAFGHYLGVMASVGAGAVDLAALAGGAAGLALALMVRRGDPGTLDAGALRLVTFAPPGACATSEKKTGEVNP